MSRIEKAAIHDFVNGEIVTELTLDQMVEVLRTAGNDTYDRVIKSYYIIDGTGATKATQDLDTVLNTIRLQEGTGISLQLDDTTSTVTITVNTGVIVSQDTLNTHKTSSDHDGRYYTETEVDAKLQGVVVGQVPDGSITPAKLSFDPATQQELDTASTNLTDQIDTKITKGTANTDIQQLMSFLLATDTRTWTATAWDSGLKPTHIDIKDGSTVVATLDLTRSIVGKLTQCVVVADGKTVTYNIDWTESQFNSITKVVS